MYQPRAGPSTPGCLRRPFPPPRSLPRPPSSRTCLWHGCLRRPDRPAGSEGLSGQTWGMGYMTAAAPEPWRHSGRFGVHMTGVPGPPPAMAGAAAKRVFDDGRPTGYAWGEVDLSGQTAQALDRNVRAKVGPVPPGPKLHECAPPPGAPAAPALPPPPSPPPSTRGRH